MFDCSNGHTTRRARYSESLSLIIAARGVKPAVAMKTLSGRFRFVVLGVIVIVAVGCSCYFPSIPDKRISLYSVKIGPRQKSDPQYVPWKSRGQFDAALKQVCPHGTYCLQVKLDPPASTVIPHYHPSDSNCTNCSGLNIRTVKVTKSKAAERTAAGAAVANDPNVTWRVMSSEPSDIKAVLDSLQ